MKKSDQTKYSFEKKVDLEYEEKHRKTIIKDEINKLFIRKEKGDPKARDELIINNLGLVKYNAKKFISQYYSYDDLVSIGTVGLIKAIDTFSLDRKVNFGSYATICIENEILMFMRKNIKHNDFVQSFYTVIAINPNNGEKMYLQEIIQDKNEVIEECVERTFYEKELEKTFNIILNYGNQKHKRCMLYYIAGYTQGEIEKILNLSQSHISRIIKKIIKEVKKKCFKLAQDESIMYNVKIKDSTIRICAKNAKKYDVSKINEILIKDTFIKKTSNIQYSKGNLIIKMPLVQESFGILAELIYWIE